MGSIDFGREPAFRPLDPIELDLLVDSAAEEMVELFRARMTLLLPPRLQGDLPPLTGTV